MAQSWIAVSLVVEAEHEEAIANFLVESGAPGVVCEAAGERVAITGHFAAQISFEGLLRYCHAIGCRADLSAYCVHEENWAENWKVHFPPIAVGQRLWICPPWITTRPPGRHAIVINPGVAFGTGHHASTMQCLELIDAHLAQSPAAAAGLDLGTGSGILAIALAKLGVRRITAIDTDPTACEVARGNAFENQVGNLIEVLSQWDHGTARYELIVSNLYAAALIELSARFANSLAPAGILICAGFVHTDEAAVRSAFETAGLRCTQRREHEHWIALAFQPAVSS